MIYRAHISIVEVYFDLERKTAAVLYVRNCDTIINNVTATRTLHIYVTRDGSLMLLFGMVFDI